MSPFYLLLKTVEEMLEKTGFFLLYFANCKLPFPSIVNPASQSFEPINF